MGQGRATRVAAVFEQPFQLVGRIVHVHAAEAGCGAPQTVGQKNGLLVDPSPQGGRDASMIMGMLLEKHLGQAG